MNVANFIKRNSGRGVRRFTVLHQDRCCADCATFTIKSAVAIAGAVLVRFQVFRMYLSIVLMMCRAAMHHRSMAAMIGNHLLV